MRKLGFMKKLGFIIGIIVLLMAVMPMSDGLAVQAADPDDPEWYWKPGNWTDYAMSGMPDFDQRQDAWGAPWDPPPVGPWTYCGPVAVANSMWWFDSREETGGIPPPAMSDNYPLVTNYSMPWDDHDPQNVDPLVRDLAWLMNTDGLNWGGASGTDVFDMQKGIDQFLVNAGLYGYYYERTVKSPNFSWIKEEVLRCEDVILLLGFWQCEWIGPEEDDYYWWRFGGHYVTCAGVNTNASKPWIGISDPDCDKHDRVPVPHGPYPHGPGVHNNATLVSHDVYNVIWDPCPGGNWSLENYAADFSNFQYQNGMYNGSYNDYFEVHTQIDYAVAVSPKPDLNEAIDSDYEMIEIDVSVRVHVADETLNNTIYDMDILFWTKQYGTEWVKHIDFAQPLKFCENYTFNVPFGGVVPPEKVVLHFSNEDDENIGFAFSEPAEEPEPPGWYWKPGNWTDYAPSGMPDFDQRQDGWFNSVGRWTYCGPTAVANSLWWFDSREETGGIPPPTSSDNYGLVTSYNASGWDDHDPQNVIPLVNDLSWLMDTDGLRTGMPHNGTDVHDMEWGIDQYLNNTGYADDYYEVTVKSPEFLWIEEEVERCEDVILLLGFWQEWVPGEWYRLGGHYVTVAGVNSYTWQLGISDPDCDNAEAGWPGIVPVAHNHTAAGAGTHNDTQYVSHDIYDVIWDPCPGGDWSLANYTVNKDINNFVGQNWATELLPYYWPYYEPGEPVHTQIDYAVAVSPINATLVGLVDFWRATPAPCSTHVTGLEVRFFDNSTKNETGWSPINVTTDDQGNFTIGGIAPGTYDIGIKNWTCLGKMNMSVQVNPGETKVVDFGMPTEADSVYDDDIVDGWDYIMELNNYGAMKIADPAGWAANQLWKGDFNRDEMIDGWDYTAVLNNYGDFGEIFLYTH